MRISLKVLSGSGQGLCIAAIACYNSQRNRSSQSLRPSYASRKPWQKLEAEEEQYLRETTIEEEGRQRLDSDARMLFDLFHQPDMLVSYYVCLSVII
jgi:hypothetical protein